MTQSLKIKWRIQAVYLCTFGNYLAPVLIAAHTANSVDFGSEPEDERYENGA